LENRPKGEIDASEIKITIARRTHPEPALPNLSIAGRHDFDN
jgi:hypothetical protein